jgi:molecular chaperone HscC
VFDGEARCLDASVGGPLLPSAVAFDGDRLLIGEAARLRSTTTLDSVKTAFKRDMGTDKLYTFGPHALGPVECSAMILRELREVAERALATAVQDAVISVPAYFGERQRNATKDAAELAGLRVMRLINEPTAAALAYGLHNQSREFKATVLDLGGGTFDVTVLEMLEGVIEVQGTAGDVQLGGEDFTRALVGHVQAHIEAAGARLSNKDVARLVAKLEAAKLELSFLELVPFVFTTLEHEFNVELELTRARAEELWVPLLQRIRAPIRRALRDARTLPEEIDEVLLVGGATRMPCISGLARDLFDREAAQHLPPDEAVALGAAVQAALMSNAETLREVVMTDIAPFTLGVETSHKLRNHLLDGTFTPVLERGTLLPASRCQVLAPLQDLQTSIELKVYQGEHSHCSQNTLLGTVYVPGIPRGASENRQVEVRFTYDLSGVLEVECTVLATKKRHRVVLDQSGRLSPVEIERIRKGLQRLKFHPREALPNVVLLGKADALFCELTGRDRVQLGQAIEQFRSVLESQEPKLIERQRAELVAVVDAFSKRSS